MIDRLPYNIRGGIGLCEVCGKAPATRKARFTAKYLQTTSIGVLEEETLVGVPLEKRVCDGCLASLEAAKNVTNLTFERL